ncbi:ABC transporter ATP-binding protein [Halobacillus sp. ACCC02827]|uniref:ABC transporter ATP-binding protein n=1 Tax=Halobacillus sp. ACCC02827 TaxID=3052090 RepID=UPI002570D071|nr:ABC transporter ATP-binding protein [Halobacillus sp. ACCC02827]WJE16378.1 ABC transporter ATP-binding protein [Halobacillus sp. ACCC02827]
MKEIIRFENVTKKYKETTAIEPLNFHIDRQDIVGLLGPNGAGKTTILKMIATLTYPTSGDIYINGKPNRKKNPIISCIMEGNRNLYWKLTVKENIEFLLTLKGTNYKTKQDQITTLMDEFALTSKRNELVQNLSRGMQQKLSILIALVEDTQIILLDEPTLGLDVSTLRDLEKLLPSIPHQMNKSLLITSHDMRFVEKVCNRVMILQEGKLVAEKHAEELKTMMDAKTGTVTVKDMGGMEGVLEQQCLAFVKDNDGLHITFHNMEEFMGILELAGDKGEIIAFHYGQTALEDLFLEAIQ